MVTAAATGLVSTWRDPKEGDWSKPRSLVVLFPRMFCHEMDQAEQEQFHREVGKWIDWYDEVADDRSSQPRTAAAVTAPISWAPMNAGAFAGAMPLNVSVNERARVTAGLANEVDAVNQ